MLKVKHIKDYIVEAYGSSNLMINEVVKFENGAEGIVMKANTKKAFIALFDQSIDNPIAIDSIVTPTKEEFKVKVNEKMLGNIINVKSEILTNYIPTKGSIRSVKTEVRQAFRLARPIYSRDFIKSPLVTGIAGIDWTIPIGKGQRELILGDRKTGKTSIVLNAILAQINTKVISVYVAIGQKKTSVLELYGRLREFGMLDRTIIVTSSSDQTSTKKWLAPYVGVTIAEYFQEKYGDDVLIIYDDLSKHADAYRELSLLMKSAPAREAYPGDIFYLHSKLLERAGKFSKDFGDGSITALPVVQTEAGDITSYIPTNVISITDGQVFTSKTLFNAGHKPAIDIPYSVSRVGSEAQIKLIAKLSSGLKLKVSEFEEAMKMARLSGSVSEENKEVIESGRVLNSMLVQPEFSVTTQEMSVIMLSLFREGYLNFYKTSTQIVVLKELISNFLETDYVGRELKKTLTTSALSTAKATLINEQLILPLIKRHIINEEPEVAKEEAFVNLFKNIRNDEIIFNNLKKEVARRKNDNQR